MVLCIRNRIPVRHGCLMPPLRVLLGGLLGLMVLGAVESISETTLIVNAGSNITLHCEGKEDAQHDIAWIQYGKKVRPSSRIRHKPDGRLLIHGVFSGDEGLYVCQDLESNMSIHSLVLRVRSPPERVSNFSVLPRSVFALATWNSPPSSPNLPLLNYDLLLRLPGETHWRQRTVDGSENSFTFYDLCPNSTYYFRIRPHNAVGPGESVSLMARTTYDPKEIREAAREGNPRPDFKIWMAALALCIILSALGALGISIFLIRIRGRSRNDITVETTEEEAMELVPHITLNPSFNIDMLEYIQAEEGSINEDRSEDSNLVSLPNG